MNDILGHFLKRWRTKCVLPHISGKLLDIGCGSNLLVRRYGNGVGADVFDWGNVDCLVADTASLPFNDSEFQTISMVASFNHIPNRLAVLRECRRLLADDGRLVVTMLTPSISRVWHWLRSPWDADQCVRGMAEGEVFGFTAKEMRKLFASQGFELKARHAFMLSLNTIYIFIKKHDWLQTGDTCGAENAKANNSEVAQHK